MKDGVDLTDFDASGFYKINQTVRSDAGSYQCLAKNKAGIVFSERVDVVVACKH
jgi:protein sidekick